MQRYRVLEEIVQATDDRFAALLAKAHAERARATCLCRDEADLPLYVSARQGGHVLARWPGTGANHSPDCDHYDAPDQLTGKGQVQGSAIVEDEESGEATLKLGFPLARGVARSAPAALTNDKPSVVSKGSRLSMRGLLHFLWDRAELTHWHPKMAGKRNWFVVRRALVNAAMTCRAKGDPLLSTLFVPESYKLDQKEAIAGRRWSELATARASKDAIMVIIAEVKSIEPARFGERVVLRHLPDWPVLMNEDMARRFHKRFAVEEELWQADGSDGHLMIAASFSIGASGLPQLFEAAVMPVTAGWLPYESYPERELVAKVVSEGRRFVKGLRFNLGLDVPVASLTLTDTAPIATAVYLSTSMPEPSFEEALAALMETPGVAHLVWQPGTVLPSASYRRALRMEGEPAAQ